MPEEISVLEITCRECGQKGKLEEKEGYEIEFSGIGGDCGDDSRVYFYGFRILEGEFEVAHKNPHLYDHTITCKKCGSTKMDRNKGEMS